MGKVGTRLPSLCLKKIRPQVRVRSPPIQSKVNVNISTTTAPANYQNTASGNVAGNTSGEEKSSQGVKPLIGRKIMIVVDSSFEAKGALQWALSHTVQSQDLLILLHVAKPSNKQASTSEESSPRDYELVNSLKNMCQMKRPEIQIEIAVVEGKEKGPSIVEEAKRQGVALLVLGQKKRSMTWRLIMMWASSRVTGGVVEYCIQNADCMAIAVRRKSRKHGGYLITTKRHRDFWLLA